MANFSAARIPDAQLEELLSKYGMQMSPDLRNAMMENLIGRRQVALPSAPATPLDSIHQAAEQSRDFNSMRDSQSFTPEEWMSYMEGTADAMKEVLGYLKAQMSLDMFAHNPQAKRMYTIVIRAGLQALFKVPR